MNELTNDEILHGAKINIPKLCKTDFESTGCPACDEAQKTANDKTSMCPQCELGMLDAEIACAMTRIEELKNQKRFRKEKENGHSHN